MGNSDKWTTPKQIKIEREGEPRGYRRGLLKKKDRWKGKKARIDELLAAKKELIRYAGLIVEERQRKIDHPEWFRNSPGSSYFAFNWDRRFDESRTKLDTLLAKALADGFVLPDEVEEYMVEKP